MISPDDINNLSQLARIAVPEAEQIKLAKDLESIVGYVSDLKNAPQTAVDSAVDAYLPTNVLREDVDPYPTAEGAGAFIKVKKIL